MLFIVLSIIFTHDCFAQIASSEQKQDSSQEQSMVGGTQALILEASDPVRNYPYPGGYNLPALPGYWGIITPDGRFQKLQDIVQFKPSWSVFDAENLISQEEGKVKLSISKPFRKYNRSGYLVVIVIKPQNPNQLQAFNDSFELISVGNGYGEGGASSTKVLGEMVKAGLEVGADAIVYNEGAGLELKASGWGIGLSNSLSVVNSPSAGTGMGNVTAGGFGYTSAKSRYATNPWLQVSFLKAKPGKSAFFIPSTPSAPSAPAGNNDKPYPEGGIDKLDTIKEGKTPKELTPKIVGSQNQ